MLLIQTEQKTYYSDGIIGLVDDSPQGVPWSFEPLSGYANPNQENLAMVIIQILGPQHGLIGHPIGMANGMVSMVNMFVLIKNHTL